MEAAAAATNVDEVLGKSHQRAKWLLQLQRDDAAAAANTQTLKFVVLHEIPLTRWHVDIGTFHYLGW